MSLVADRKADERTHLLLLLASGLALEAAAVALLLVVLVPVGALFIIVVGVVIFYTAPMWALCHLTGAAVMIVVHFAIRPGRRPRWLAIALGVHLVPTLLVLLAVTREPAPFDLAWPLVAAPLWHAFAFILLLLLRPAAERCPVAFTALLASFGPVCLIGAAAYELLAPPIRRLIESPMPAVPMAHVRIDVYDIWQNNDNGLHAYVRVTPEEPGEFDVEALFERKSGKWWTSGIEPAVTRIAVGKPEILRVGTPWFRASTGPATVRSGEILILQCEWRSWPLDPAARDVIRVRVRGRSGSAVSREYEVDAVAARQAIPRP
jgi:hypothetical protein